MKKDMIKRIIFSCLTLLVFIFLICGFVSHSIVKKNKKIEEERLQIERKNFNSYFEKYSGENNIDSLLELVNLISENNRTTSLRRITISYNNNSYIEVSDINNLEELFVDKMYFVTFSYNEKNVINNAKIVDYN